MSLRVHHLNCGTMCPRSEYLVNGHGSLFGRARIVCHVLLVEGNDGLLLVDTGLGLSDVREPSRLGNGFVRRNAPHLDEAETAIAQVRALGFRPEDVRNLLPTHLDVDHAGGLADFPAASVHVFQAELAALEAPDKRYRAGQFSHGPKWSVHGETGESWFGFEAVKPVPGAGDDVLLVPLCGHTLGHTGVAVRTEKGWVLHAGDAYFSHLEMRGTKPRAPLGLALFQRRHSANDAARRTNQDRLRTLVREHGEEVRVLSAHCPVELDDAQRPLGDFAA